MVVIGRSRSLAMSCTIATTPLLPGSSTAIYRVGRRAKLIFKCWYAYNRPDDLAASFDATVAMRILQNRPLRLLPAALLTILTVKTTLSRLCWLTTTSISVNQTGDASHTLNDAARSMRRALQAESTATAGLFAPATRSVTTDFVAIVASARNLEENMTQELP
jgi:hypothetical protein